MPNGRTKQRLYASLFGSYCKRVCDRIDFVRGEQASFVDYPFYYIVGTDVKTGMT